jgi:tRNA modification GTPase
VTLGRAGGSGSGSGGISFSSSSGGDEVAAAVSGAAAGNDGALATAGEDTIAAVVTGPSSQGAVAIVRISGASAVGIAQRLFRPARRGGGNGGGDGASNNSSSSSSSSSTAQQWRPKSHRVYYGTLVDAGGATIDEAMLLPMLAPRCAFLGFLVWAEGSRGGRGN